MHTPSHPQSTAQQLPLDLAMRPALGREDFLIGPENRDAASWIDKWPNWSAPALILSGPAASGKTHLAAVWCEQSNAQTYRPSEMQKLTAEDIAAASQHVVIDGFDPWVGDEHTETTLFHLYNIMKENGNSLLITMRMSPAHIDFALPDLASRLRAAPLAAIQSPDDNLLTSILVKQFYDRQLNVSAEVINYVLPRMERSFAAAQTIVDKADRAALSQKRGISIPLMRQVLADLQAEA